jgi:glycosyltransferase involved in cell wall biosynthesis
MSKPLVSVAMVVCNVDRFLGESIESILHQTFTDFEFIIVDFGSTDKSKAIISSYAAKDSRIKFHEVPHCCLAEARNVACSLAQGRYIAVMDADDVSLPNRLKWEVDFMETHLQVGLVGGATEWIDGTGRSLGIHDFPTEDHEIRSALTVRCPFCQPTVLIRREAFVLVGGYRTVYAQAEDYDLWLRIAERFEVANLKQVVLKYRIHPYQMTLRKRTQQTLCFLAAQASASSRRNGNPDTVNSIEEITPAVLAGLGVSEATQQITAATGYLFWIRTMYAAGEYSSALKAAVDALQSPDWEYAERWQIANMRLMAARLYWKQRRFAKGFLAAVHAFMTRPIMLGRPLKPLMRWFWLRTVARETRDSQVQP